MQTTSREIKYRIVRHGQGINRKNRNARAALAQARISERLLPRYQLTSRKLLALLMSDTFRPSR